MKHLRYIILCILAVLLASCEQQQRDRNGILSERAMADVLYDYQIALALAGEDVSQPGELAELEYRYTQAVFRKHKIDQNTFDLSLAHYARDPKSMLALTEKVSKRLTEEEKKSQQFNDDAGGVLKGDTTILWENRDGFVLTANGNNRREIDIPLKKSVLCDRLLFGFEADWIYSEGGRSKSGGIVLQVKFDNDSVAVQAGQMRQFDKSQGLSVQVPKGRKVKSVKAYVVQSAFWENFTQLLSVRNLSVWAIKTKDNDKQQSQPSKPVEAPELPGAVPGNPKQRPAMPE